MGDFKRLVELLDEEIRTQEKILEVLAKERIAIVELKQDQNELILAKKDQLITEASEIEKKRSSLLTTLTGIEKKPKVADAVAKCDTTALRQQLEDRSKELRKIGRRVKEMNLHNAALLKQALGIVSSTLSILRSGPASEAPTYGGTGTMKSSDNALPRRRSLTTEA